MTSEGSDSSDPGELMRAGRQALEQRDWLSARQAFEGALLAAATAEAFEGLGSAAWWLHDGGCVLEAREQAYRLYQKQSDARSAARLAIALAGDFLGFRGEPAIAQGWQQRARELLQGAELAPERGWLMLTEGDFALSVLGDPGAAAASAEQALEIARQLGVDDLRVLAHALLGAALVAKGHVAEGMSRLDGAVTTALSGDVEDPIAIGYSCCYMLQACERARDFDRATQWCERVRVFSERCRFEALLAVCRAHHASLLIGRGHWQEAEAELDAAARQLAASRPPLLGEALLRLAGLRRRQGRLEEAADLLQGLAGDPAALAEQAALALARGDASTALALSERLLRRIPEHNLADRLGVLELCARARLALGQHEAAGRAVAELRGGGSLAPALEASVRSCEGLLARLNGDSAAARRALEDAVDGFQRCRAPFELGQARLELGRQLCAEGLRELGVREAQAAVQGFAALGAQGELERARAWLVEEAAAPPSGDDQGLSPREIEVLRLLARGLSNRGIAGELGVSEFTIKRHVQNILTKLALPTRAAAASHAVRSGLC